MHMFLWIFPYSDMKKSDCFFLPQLASCTTEEFLGLDAGAPPDEQREQCHCFQTGYRELLMLSCRLPLDLCGGGCICV